MKRILLFPILYLLMFVPAGRAQAPGSWYKVFTGQVSGQAATVHLHKAGNKYGGYIWFARDQWPMPVYSGGVMKGSDSFQISAGNGPVVLLLTGIMDKDQFYGMSRMDRENDRSGQSVFQLKRSADKSFTVFRYYYAQGNARLPAEMKNESACTVNKASVWPDGNSIYEENLKRFIRQALGDKANTDPQAILNREKEKSINSWKQENRRISAGDASRLGLSLSYQEDSRIMVMFENERFITLADYRYVYSGGAHGNYQTKLASFSKPSGKRLRLSDVLTETGIRVLPQLLDRVARIQYGAKSTGSLQENGFLVDRIGPSKEFYVTGSGLGFLYAPYEIKSFADGEVNLMVPFELLTPYLKEEFKGRGKK